jgi:DegV family protein with EDD domain
MSVVARIGIVTDSTAYLPCNFKRLYQIEVVSLIINFEGVSMPEDEMDYDRFYDRLRRASHLPTTSQPSVGDFLDVYRRVAERSDSIISIHLTGGISGAVKTAAAAAQMLYPLDITVVDCHSTSVGLYLVVEAAARAVEAGLSRDEILEIVDHIIRHSLTLFTLDTLEYLRRGGRIGAAAAILGNLLQVKPILFFDRENDVIDVYEKVRTRERALQRILEAVEQQGPDIRVCVAHAGDEATGQKLRSRVKAVYPHLNPELCPMGPVVGAHGGRGTVGLSFYPLTPKIASLFPVKWQGANLTNQGNGIALSGS